MLWRVFPILVQVCLYAHGQRRMCTTFKTARITKKEEKGTIPLKSSKIYINFNKSSVACVIVSGHPSNSELQRQGQRAPLLEVIH
jgi:hypothetical protein